MYGGKATLPTTEYAFEVSMCDLHSICVHAWHSGLNMSILCYPPPAHQQLPRVLLQMACSNIRYGEGVTQEVGMVSILCKEF